MGGGFSLWPLSNKQDGVYVAWKFTGWEARSCEICLSGPGHAELPFSFLNLSRPESSSPSPMVAPAGSGGSGEWTRFNNSYPFPHLLHSRAGDKRRPESRASCSPSASSRECQTAGAEPALHHLHFTACPTHSLLLHPAARGS